MASWFCESLACVWTRFSELPIQDGSVVTPGTFLGPICPVESSGLEFFQVEMERRCHEHSVEVSGSPHRTKSKRGGRARIIRAQEIPVEEPGLASIQR